MTITVHYLHDTLVTVTLYTYLIIMELAILQHTEASRNPPMRVRSKKACLAVADEPS